MIGDAIIAILIKVDDDSIETRPSLLLYCSAGSRQAFLTKKAKEAKMAEERERERGKNKS